MRLLVCGVRLFVLALFWLTLSVEPLTLRAFAHAGLVASDPADGAILETAPQRISLAFSEPVRPLIARLTGPDGHTQILQSGAGVGVSVTYTLPGGLVQGTYILSWRVTSADGHPVGGGQIFSIGEATVPPTIQSSSNDIAVQTGLWASRFLLAIGIILGGGSAFFISLWRMEPSRQADLLVTTLLLAGLLAAPLAVGFQGLDALGEPIDAIGDTRVWFAGLFATSYGRAILLAIGALVLVGIAHSFRAQDGRLQHVLASGGLVLAAASFAGAGHAASAPPRILTTPGVFLHALSVIGWLGALIPLTDALSRRDESGLLALRRFSHSILPVIVCLVASGFFLAAIQLEHPSTLWMTHYGLVLLMKLALVGLFFLLAAANRFILTPRFLVGHEQSRRALRRNALLEIVLSLAIVATVGLWRFTPPPRAITGAAPPVHAVSVASAGLKARLILSPARVGAASVKVVDISLDGKPFHPLSVQVELGKPSYGIGPFTHEAIGRDDVFTASGFVLPLDGFWVVRATVLVDDFRSVILTDIFDVQPAGTKNAFPVLDGKTQ